MNHVCHTSFTVNSQIVGRNSLCMLQREAGVYMKPVYVTGLYIKFPSKYLFDCHGYL